MKAAWVPLVVAAALTAGAASVLFQKPKEERILGRFATSLDGRGTGQRHNAKLALEMLDGSVVQPGSVWSFNRDVGNWSRIRGFRRAPVSFDGEMVPAWGGGVCQTSSTVYNAALLAGLEIVERHPHHFAPDYVPAGRDAAVAYDTIDLKIRNPYDRPVVLEGRVERGKLVVEVRGYGIELPRASIVQRVQRVAQPKEHLTGSGTRLRVRNPGRNGVEVSTYRYLDGKRQFLSHDTYPVQNRVVEFR